jgi:hypothetical protein
LQEASLGFTELFKKATSKKRAFPLAHPAKGKSPMPSWTIRNLPPGVTFRTRVVQRPTAALPPANGDGTVVEAAPPVETTEVDIEIPESIVATAYMAITQQMNKQYMMHLSQTGQKMIGARGPEGSIVPADGLTAVEAAAAEGIPPAIARRIPIAAGQGVGQASAARGGIPPARRGLAAPIPSTITPGPGGRLGPPSPSLARRPVGTPPNR